jgi:hypothetical protein
MRLRALIGNPDPVELDAGARRTDIVPGCILQIKYSATESVFAIISQVFQGDYVVSVQEELPGWVSGFDPAKVYSDWLKSGRNKNEYFQFMSLYGSFTETRERSLRLELIGKWSEAIKDSENGSLLVWKSGVVAHAQKLEDMRNSPYYHIDGLGGYGYLGEAHNHEVKASTDVIESENVAADTGNTDHIGIPLEHTHKFLFGAVTIPKVRPVLLCQKL